MPSQRKSKSLALKTINERMEAHDSLDEDGVEKEMAYLVKNFRKFLKFKKNGNSQVSKRRKRTSRGKMGRILNPFKESHASNATNMDILRKSVPII